MVQQCKSILSVCDCFRIELTFPGVVIFTTMETPLDVLSRAASLIEIDAAKGRSNILRSEYLMRFLMRQAPVILDMILPSAAVSNMRYG